MAKNNDIRRRIQALGLTEIQFSVQVPCSPATVSTMARGGTVPRLEARILSTLERLEREARKRGGVAA